MTRMFDAENIGLLTSRLQRGSSSFLNEDGNVHLRPQTTLEGSAEEKSSSSLGRRWSAVTENEINGLMVELGANHLEGDSRRLLLKNQSAFVVQRPGEDSYSPSMGPTRRVKSTLDWSSLQEARKNIQVSSRNGSEENVASPTGEDILLDSARTNYLPQTPAKDRLASLRSRRLSKRSLTPSLRSLVEEIDPAQSPDINTSDPQTLHSWPSRDRPTSVVDSNEAPSTPKLGHLKRRRATDPGSWEDLSPSFRAPESGKELSLTSADRESISSRSSNESLSSFSSNESTSSRISIEAIGNRTFLEPTIRTLPEKISSRSHNEHRVQILNRNSEPPHSRTLLEANQPQLSVSPSAPRSVSKVSQKISSPLNTQNAGVTKVKEQILSEDLEPLANPERELKGILDNMRSPEWDINFDAIDMLRRIVIFNPEVIIPLIRDIVALSMNFVDSLRSGLARNAIVCIGDLFQHCSKQLETELDFLVPKLTKRYCEASTFLVKEVDRTLSLLIEYFPTSKVLSVLAASYKHKHATVRNKCAFFVANCLEQRNDILLKDLEKVTAIIGQFLEEGNNETRSHGKRAAMMISKIVNNPTEFESLLRRHMSDLQVQKINDLVKQQHLLPEVKSKQSIRSPKVTTPKGKKFSPKIDLEETVPLAPGIPTIVLESPLKTTTIPRNTPTADKDKKLRKRMSFGEEIDLATLLLNLGSSDWKQRYDAISGLSNQLVTSSEDIQRKLVKIFDGFTPRLNDPNSKVLVIAITTLSKMIEVLQDSILAVIGTMLPALVGNLASSRPEVRTAALQAIDTLLTKVDKGVLIPHIASTIFGGNRKVQAPLIEKLTELLPSMYASKSQLIVKYVLPIGLSLLEEKRGETKSANQKLLVALHKEMGNALLDSCSNLSEENYQKLKSLLN